MTDGILARALADLAENPESSAREIAQRIGVRDDRLVFKVLDTAAYDGRCQRSRTGSEPWRRETNHEPVNPAGQRLYCPDHPGPLDDARNHICRMRPVTERTLP
jgi:hypothetical protein